MTKKTNITEAAAALGKLGGKKIASHAKDAPTGQRENPRALFRCAGRKQLLANPRRSRAQGADDTPASRAVTILEQVAPRGGGGRGDTPPLETDTDAMWASAITNEWGRYHTHKSNREALDKAIGVMLLRC